MFISTVLRPVIGRVDDAVPVLVIVDHCNVPDRTDKAFERLDDVQLLRAFSDEAEFRECASSGASYKLGTLSRAALASAFGCRRQ